MKNRVLISLLLLTGILSATSVSAFEQPQGEKLISSKMDPEKWERHNKDTLESKQLVWFRKALRAEGRPFDDFYTVTIYNQSENDLDHMRNRNDEPGRRYCDAFESIDLPEVTNKNYASKFWRTHCVKSRAPEARIIHLTIKGKGHIYHIQKGWRGEVEQTKVDEWVDRIKKIYLCDVNREDAPCPVDPAQISGNNDLAVEEVAIAAEQE